MLALLGVRDFYTNANIPNVGQTPFLQTGAVVESYANFSRNNIKPVVSKRLPSIVESLVRRVSDVQCMTLKASLAKDRELAFQALLYDPLVNISTDKARKMFMEMLSNQKSLMPGWKI